MFRTTLEECSVIAGPHLALAYRNTLKYSNHPGYKTLNGGGVLLVLGGSHPLCNSAIGVKDDELDFCVDALVACNEPAMFSFTDPTPSLREKELETHGFNASPPAPAMAVEIERLPRIPCPPAYGFRRCGPDALGVEWVQTITAIFGIPADTCALFGPGAYPISSAPDDQVQYFEVVHNGEVVAVSMMVLDQGVAGIYCVGTIKEHRGKGLGALVTAEPLRQSRALGYKIGVLQASSLGLPVYQRIGFQEVSQVRSYVRLPSA